ncbi:MAG: tape measure protein [Cytophagaceae bacterium]|nr:tape measure protein [Cytophagaceae bacterium]
MDTRIRIIAEAITKDAENNLKRLADLERELQGETTKASDAAKKQETNLNSLNDTGSKTNTMFRNIGATMIGLFAVDKIIDYTKQMIGLMAETDKLRIALSNVVKNNKDYENSLKFLTDLSQKYGQNVNILTQAYTNFIASSNSTNLSLKQRQDIYASIIKAGSALKLSNDSIEGSLLAVSQMFSKGNISAEELRGQLGERLPGSFGIMAKALGVNEKQLNKMLEQGQVLAEDALPKFAKALEEVYGDKAQSNLKTIGGAWNVFVNNFIEGLQDFNKSSLFIETISKWILSAANGFKNFIDVIKEAFTIGTQYNNVLNTMFDYYEIVWGAIKNVGGALWDLIETLADVIFNITGAGNASKFLQYWVDVVSYAIKGLGTGLIGAITLTQALADTFNALINTGKKVLNFFGGDFKIDTNATFGAVADNFKKNVGRIGNLWTDSQKGILGTNKTTQKAIIDESENTTNNILKQNEGLTEKQKKELLKRSLDKQKALEKDQEENEKAWASFLKTLTKAMKDADDIMRKPFDEQYKRLIKQSQDESESSKKNIEAKRESLAERSKLLAYHDMMEVINNAKTLKEIEDAEKKYSDRILQIDIDLINEKIKQKKRELLLKKSSGSLELKQEEDLKAEIEKLEKELTAIKRKEGETQIKDKKDQLKEQENIEEEYQKRKKKALDEEMDFEMLARKIFNKALRDLTEEEYQQLLNISDKKKKLAEDFKEAAKQSFEFISNFILDRYNDDLEEKLSRATSITEKAAIEQERAWLNVGKSVTGAVNALAQGNYVGAIVGGVQSLFQAMDTWVMGAANEQKAKMEQYYQEMKAAGEAFIKAMDGMFTSSDIESIKSVYGGLIDTFNTTLRLDLGEFDNPERRLQQEILIGEQIVANYNKAVTNENGLHSQKIDNINSEYNASVKAINDKYNLEKGLADTAFGAASLAIQEQTNQQLIALLTNQDTRLSLDADYNAKRAYIFNQYASQIKDITPEMSQVEIDGINAAIQARDNALSEVEKWLQEELKFVLSNEEQKRKEYSATEKIIKDGEDAIEALRIEYNANELERLTTKNLAIEAAEKNKNAILETETKRHNESIAAITKAKDEQLAESFKILQDIIKNGYDEIMAKALDAYNAGKITADQYNEIAKRLYTINTLINGIGDWTLPNLNIDNLNLPRFNTGTEKVGGKKGVDKNLALLSYDEGVIRGDLNEKRLNAGLNMHKTIEYAINYKSILDGGLQPLKIKESALNKLEEHAAMQYLLNFNMKPVVEKLDSVERALKSIPIQNFNLDEKGLSKYVETKNNVTKFKNKRLK